MFAELGYGEIYKWYGLALAKFAIQSRLLLQAVSVLLRV